ncbi:MAG TPA: phosphoribosylanthranilate isomerase [Solirubrobacteraceae bacterium]|nr:phosphoribosylanthranilate isomerase [Solirubrobacteraceae bacterium]
MLAPRVKICGITKLADAERSVELGAWAIGLIFHARSPRRCRHDDALLIASSLRRRVEVCGVFVNATIERVVKVAEDVGLSLVQLHGDEGPAYCREVARRTGCRVIKAARVRSAADLRAMRPYRVDYHLLDSGARGMRGGSGVTWDWGLVRDRRDNVPLIVSGGLTPGNVGDAIAAAAPFAVDVASGTEGSLGRKDPAKLEAFFAAVAESAAEPVS